jgi:hypothetical protein
VAWIFLDQQEQQQRQQVTDQQQEQEETEQPQQTASPYAAIKAARVEEYFQIS